MLIKYSHMMHSIMLVHTCANTGLYINRHSKGEDNLQLGLCCNSKSCGYSKNKATQEGKLLIYIVESKFVYRTSGILSYL